jgi:hypothetical protein
MKHLRLAPRVDLGVYYDADASRYTRPDDAQALRVVTREYFIARYRDCPSIGFEYDGEPIGGIVFDGEAAHIAVLPAWHGRWALLLRPALEWLFALEAEMLVEVAADNAVCLEFMRRNGWPVVGTRDGRIVHRLSKQPRRRRRHPIVDADSRAAASRG